MAFAFIGLGIYYNNYYFGEAKAKEAKL